MRPGGSRALRPPHHGQLHRPVRVQRRGTDRGEHHRGAEGRVCRLFHSRSRTAVLLPAGRFQLYPGDVHGALQPQRADVPIPRVALPVRLLSARQRSLRVAQTEGSAGTRG